MENENFVLVSIDDDKSKDLADVLANKTCKKIINFILEKDGASAKDISDALNIGMSGVDYNLKKLLKSGLVEKKKDFFWSKKGKKIVMYNVSNKSIVISPKKDISSKIKSLIPAILLVSSSTFAVYVYEKINGAQNVVQKTMDIATPSLANSVYGTGSSNEMARIVGQGISQTHLWIWFLSGAVLAFIIFSILNWKKL
jgi:predicted transcriptional regulator